MASRVAGTCTNNGLLSQNLTGTVGGDSSYACGFLSNYTKASTCCAPEIVHEFPDPCYSWCDLPSSMNNQIDNDRDFSMLDYMKSCLNQTGETIGPLWCRMTQPHVIVLPKSTATDGSAEPTSTFSAEEFCQLQTHNCPYQHTTHGPHAGFSPATPTTLHSNPAASLRLQCGQSYIATSTVTCREEMRSGARGIAGI